MNNYVNDDLFCGFGIEVRLKNEEDFLKVKETLTRIGVSVNSKKVLYQSCHILHKRGRYAIMNFKELYALDSMSSKNRNTFSNIDENDIARRNRIVKVLSDWGLVEEVDPIQSDEPICNINQIRILKHKESKDWELIPKYTIGKYRTKAKDNYDE